jgi:predicted DNA-binding protein (UPF0278 family)
VDTPNTIEQLVHEYVDEIFDKCEHGINVSTAERIEAMTMNEFLEIISEAIEQRLKRLVIS